MIYIIIEREFNNGIITGTRICDIIELASNNNTNRGACTECLSAVHVERM